MAPGNVARLIAAMTAADERVPPLVKEMLRLLVEQLCMTESILVELERELWLGIARTR
jgi:hypothetical protein